MPEKAARAKQAKNLATTAAVEDAPSVRPQSTRDNEAAEAFAVQAARILLDDHCEDVLVLDLRRVLVPANGLPVEDLDDGVAPHRRCGDEQPQPKDGGETTHA